VNTIALILAVLVGAQFSVLAVAIAVFVVQTLFLSLFSYFVPLAILEVGNNDVELYRQNRDRNPVLNWLNFSKVS
jgi:hypothetical protein